jgi:general nucleoside transport system permease protein
MLKLEARSAPSQFWAYASPVLALLITVVIAVLLFVSLGKDPVKGLSAFFYEPMKNVYQLTELGIKATPLILCALGLSICYRSNVWNIGAEGQYLMGAIFGGGIALWVTTVGATPGGWIIAIVLVAGMLGGMFWAGIVALLKDRFNASEILVSLMLVYVANLLLSYLVFGPWKDPMGFNFPQTKNFDAAVSMPKLVTPGRLHWGFVVALAMVGLVWFFMSKTFAGFKLRVGGLAPLAARYAGFSDRRALWTALLLSGALAGLAGAMEATGPLGQLTPYVSTGYGFTAIIVAFLGRLHPLGCVFASILLSMFLIGGELAQSRLGLPNAITGVFQGLLLFALLACDTLINFRVRFASTPKSRTDPGAQNISPAPS